MLGSCPVATASGAYNIFRRRLRAVDKSRFCVLELAVSHPVVSATLAAGCRAVAHLLHRNVKAISEEKKQPILKPFGIGENRQSAFLQEVRSMRIHLHPPRLASCLFWPIAKSGINGRPWAICVSPAWSPAIAMYILVRLSVPCESEVHVEVASAKVDRTPELAHDASGARSEHACVRASLSSDVIN